MWNNIIKYTSVCSLVLLIVCFEFICVEPIFEQQIFNIQAFVVRKRGDVKTSLCVCAGFMYWLLHMEGLIQPDQTVRFFFIQSHRASGDLITLIPLLKIVFSGSNPVGS